jgi:hypothetical protein
MTKARLFGTPVQVQAGEESLTAVPRTAMGRYTYMPASDASGNSTPGARGILRGDGEPVELRVTEPLLGDFLASLNRTQDELNQRWSVQGRPGSNVACA